MKFQRGLTRFVAALTTISLLLPTAIFAFTASTPLTSPAIGTATGLESANGQASIGTTFVTLQAQDLFGLLNGEVGGIPQFGLAGIEPAGWTPSAQAVSLRGDGQGLLARVERTPQTRTDGRYEAVPLASDALIAPADVALVGNDATEILLRADGQASEAFKLTSRASLPLLIEAPLEGPTTIKDLMDRTLAVASAAPMASKSAWPAGTHRFGTVLTGLKPTVDAAPFGREWATVIFGSFALETTMRLLGTPDGDLSSPSGSWAILWLELLIGLAGAVALSRARRGHSIRHDALVILNREQRE